jgi:hypothetical protein
MRASTVVQVLSMPINGKNVIGSFSHALQQNAQSVGIGAFFIDALTNEVVLTVGMLVIQS